MVQPVIHMVQNRFTFISLKNSGDNIAHSANLFQPKHQIFSFYALKKGFCIGLVNIFGALTNGIYTDNTHGIILRYPFPKM